MLTTIAFPRQLALDARVNGSPIQQVQVADLLPAEYEVVPWKRRQAEGHQLVLPSGEAVLILERSFTPPTGVSHVLKTSGGALPASLDDVHELKAQWLQPKASRDPLTADPDACRDSWVNQFHFKEEETLADETVVTGLRPPQVGAVYATLAHWKVSSEPATIVMPTGTGKTETMIALLVHQRFSRLLIVVPNDALRTQIAEKFLTFGVLKEFGVIGPGALFPIVTRLERQLKSADEAQEVFGPANVIVTTMQVLNGCAKEAQARIVELCSHLFIDEAHHVSAPSWDYVRRLFAERKVLQFTATPFRNDRKHVPGTVIFNYPLRKAQAENYFRPIKFDHVWEFDPEKADHVIAERAVAYLRADLAAGYDHLLMARADSISRAEQVIKAYARYTDLRPVIVHTGMTETERRTALTQIRQRVSRVAVCVNMFGEGFDLPQLKVAALHDVHKSLAVTLQYTGRFTRSKAALGEAKVIANLADIKVQEALQNLYAETADWNVLLRELSEGATGKQVRDSDFFREFDTPQGKFAIQNITPKMSTVVYKGKNSTWNPKAIPEAMKKRKKKLFDEPSVNLRSKVAAFVTKETSSVEWGNFQELEEVEWHLYLLFWDQERKLLFINSTEPHTLHESLAAAVIGSDCSRIEGEDVFRTLHGINRLSLMNLGLSHTIGRSVRFTMFMGNDIFQGLTEAKMRDKIKSNVFGFGYRNAARTGAGCSVKGRLWSYQVAGSIPEWMAWCRQVGDKLLDSTINLDAMFQGVVKSTPVSQRPLAVPLALDWSESIHLRAENTITFVINGKTFYLYEVGLSLLTFDDSSPIRFKVHSETEEAEFEIEFNNGRLGYRTLRGSVEVSTGRRKLLFADWLESEPLTIFFHDRSLIIHNHFAQLSPVSEPFSRDRLEAWDWTGTNLKRESQGIGHDPVSIQYRVIQELLQQGHDIVFDDDDAYEAADIVTMRINGDVLEIGLYHCKFSGETTAGARIGDLYEVCGQAQKSVARREKIELLFEHLRHREGNRQRNHNTTRFQRGDLNKLKELMWRSRALKIDFRVHIVQPGVSKARASREQLELLAVTEVYLKETFEIPLIVITSA